MFKLRESFAFLNRKKPIMKMVKRNRFIVYGGQAIKKHIGPLARPTQDIDILTSSPRKSAKRLEKELDRKAGGNYYYTEPAKHPGTWKVKHIGPDMKWKTEDDINVADFTKPARRYKTTTLGGVRYVTIPEIIKDKRKTLRDPEYAFRHEKDRDDLKRIKLAKQLKVRWK